METQPSTKSSFQILNFDNSCQKSRGNRYCNFWSRVHFYCNSLVRAKYFGQDYLKKQTFGRKLPKSPSHLGFWVFSVPWKHFSNHDVNIKEVNSFKSFKFNGFVLAVFCILGLRQNFTLGNLQLCGLSVFQTN